MSTTDVAIRYHATPLIGLGHAVRAQALTSALQRNSATVHHVVPSAIHDLLISRGVPAVDIISVESSKWQALQQQVTHIIIDTLWSGNSAATSAEVHKLKVDTNAKITVIDSMPPDHYIAGESQRQPDLLLTPYHQANFLRSAPTRSHWLYGEEYALLGAEFQHLRNTEKSTTDDHRIVVCTGGGDADALSMRIAKALIHPSVTNISRIDIVVGPLFSIELAQKLSALATCESNIRIHEHPASIADLMQKATLIIGRPGLIRYEAACLGTSALLLSAGNQYRDYYERFNANGLAEIYFQMDKHGETNFMNRIQTLVNAAPCINKVGYDNVDGLGAQRLAGLISNSHSAAGDTHHVH